MESNNFELVFIPPPGFSQFTAAIDLAHRLAAHDPRITITILLIVDIPISDGALDSYFKPFNANESPGVSMVRLPPPETKFPEVGNFVLRFAAHMEAYKRIVKDVVLERRKSRTPQLAGFVLDMFTSTMIDVADEIGVPSYFFYAPGTCMLSFLFHLEGPLGRHLPDTPELYIPGFQNPLPKAAWPSAAKDPDITALYLLYTRRMLRSKGVLPNTFAELEPDLIQSLSENKSVPPIYPIGPIVHLDGPGQDPCRKWLDEQPPRSVVFLCFGTVAGFREEQVREIAVGLEKSGHRFLWSLRRAFGSEKGKEYADFNEVLPEGFLERTRGVGSVVGWAPQRKVLSHPSTGAFVSHCGWNSLLESVYYGVPVAAWPQFAEQQLNAYRFARELGFATEMRIDYIHYPGTTPNMLVGAAEVEEGILRVMDGEEGIAVRKKLAEISLTAKNALLHGGSSHRTLTVFIDHVIAHVSTLA